MEHPENEYIGMTKITFRKRMGEHRDYVKRYIVSEPSGEHFSKPGHIVAHLKGQVLEKLEVRTLLS